MMGHPASVPVASAAIVTASASAATVVAAGNGTERPYVCGMCRNPWTMPYRSPSCAHTFCYRCLLPPTGYQPVRSCPICAAAMSVSRARPLQDAEPALYNGYEFACLNNKSCTFCKKEFRIIDLDEHQPLCSLKPVQCVALPRVTGGCGVFLPPGNLAEHHGRVCPERFVGCFFRGCTVRLPERDMYQHERSNQQGHLRDMQRWMDQELKTRDGLIESLRQQLLLVQLGTGAPRATAQPVPSAPPMPAPPIVSATPVTSPPAHPAPPGTQSSSGSSNSAPVGPAGPPPPEAAAAVVESTRPSVSLPPVPKPGDAPLAYDMLLLGGVHPTTATQRRAVFTCQRFALNPLTDTKMWMPMQDLPTARGWSSATRWKGYVVVTGGSVVGGHRLKTVEAYDLKHNIWLTLPGLITGRDEHSTVVVGGVMYTFGGIPSGSSTASKSMEIFTPDEKDVTGGRWMAGPDMSEGRAYHAVAVVSGRIYVFGGKPSLGVAKALLTAEVYDTVTRKWTGIAPPLSVRSAHRAIVVDDKIILLGGQISSSDGKTVTAVETAEIYHVLTNKWTTSTEWKLPLPMANFSVKYNPEDGSVVVAGGWPIARSNLSFKRNAHTGNWSPMGELQLGVYEAAFA